MSDDRDRRRFADALHPARTAEGVCDSWGEGPTPVERPLASAGSRPMRAGPPHVFECDDPGCINCRHHDCAACGLPMEVHA